jgi:hypothetical protein
MSGRTVDERLDCLQLPGGPPLKVIAVPGPETLVDKGPVVRLRRNEDKIAVEASPLGHLRLGIVARKLPFPSLLLLVRLSGAFR